MNVRSRLHRRLHDLAPMTMAGWVPWLIDTFDPGDGQATFGTYVRQHSVLLRPGEARRNHVPRWLPWVPATPARLACPECAADPQRGTVLTWRLPLMTSCAEHGCLLGPEPDVRFAVLVGTGLRPAPASPHVALMDRHTLQALATGRVSLPGGSAHAGVWFRLLRTLLDEVSTAPSAVSASSRAALELIWSKAGLPVRGGLTVPLNRTATSTKAIAGHGTKGSSQPSSTR